MRSRPRLRLWRNRDVAIGLVGGAVRFLWVRNGELIFIESKHAGTCKQIQSQEVDAPDVSKRNF